MTKELTIRYKEALYGTVELWKGTQGGQIWKRLRPQWRRCGSVYWAADKFMFL